MTEPLSKEEFTAKMKEKRAEREPPAAGHNSQSQLGSYVDRLVNVFEEKDRVSQDIAELKKEAKGNGFSPQALTLLAKRRMEDADVKAKREELAAIVDTYASALGLVL